MGGAAGSSTAAYFISNSNQILTAQPLPLIASVNPVIGGTITPTSLQTFDCARESIDNGFSTNDLWVATDHPDSPIRAYNPAGALTYACNLVEDVRGMAFSTAGGHRFIWVSNPVDNMIYQIDLDYGTGVEGGPGGDAPTLDASANPFHGSVTFTGTGFGEGATIEVFDMSGRSLVDSPFGGSYTWASSAPAGVYLVRVRDAEGSEERLSVVRTGG